MQVLSLDLANPLQQVVADYLATLAYARPEEHAQRITAARKMVRWWASDLWNPSKVIRPGNRFFQKLDQRQRAVAVALPLLARSQGVETPQLADRRPTRWNPMVDEAAKLNWHSDPSDFRTRIWRPSLPTLSLGLALRLVQAERVHDHLPFDADSLFSDASIIHRALGFTGLLQQQILTMWGSQIPSNQFWQLELTSSNMPPDRR